MAQQTLTIAGFRAERSITSRTIAFLLLLLVVFGSTVEAAHRHGALSQLDKSSLTTSVTNQDASTDLAGRSLRCHDCLICQLHQNFAATLVTAHTQGAALPSREQFLEAARIALQSRVNSPGRGRAPPLTSSTTL